MFCNGVGITFKLTSFSLINLFPTKKVVFSNYFKAKCLRFGLQDISRQNKQILKTFTWINHHKKYLFKSETLKRFVTYTLELVQVWCLNHEWHSGYYSRVKSVEKNSTCMSYNQGWHSFLSCLYRSVTLDKVLLIFCHSEELKFKHFPPLLVSSPSPRFISKRSKCVYPTKDTFKNVHSNFIHYSP